MAAAKGRAEEQNMIYYVDAKAFRDGDGSRERPFKRINDAAQARRACTGSM